LGVLVLRFCLLGPFDLRRHRSTQISRSRCPIRRTHRQTRHGLDGLRAGSVWSGPCQRRMEQRALVRLGHAARLLPPHHRPLVPHRFRLGRSPRGITVNPSLRPHKASRVHDGARRHRMGILRNLDPLLLALPARSPRPDTAPHLRRVRPCDDLRPSRRWSDGLHAHSHARLIYHHGLHAGLLHRRDRRGLPTRAPDLLGTDVRVHPDHA
jgi:hypothetical protein